MNAAYKDDLAEAAENLQAALVAVARARYFKNVSRDMADKASFIARAAYELSELIETLYVDEQLVRPAVVLDCFAPPPSPEENFWWLDPK